MGHVIFVRRMPESTRERHDRQRRAALPGLLHVARTGVAAVPMPGRVAFWWSSVAAAGELIRTRTAHYRSGGSALKIYVFLTLALSAMAPAVAQAQETGVTVQGAFGTLLNASGTDVSIGVGFWPDDRVGIIVAAERVHLPTEVTQFERGFSATRGGTSTFVSGEFRFVPLRVSRVSPYGLAGAGFGSSRPNVNEQFPDPVDSFRSGALFAGGGIHVPVNRRLSLFGDVRAMLQLEDSEAGVYLFVPVRAGVAWRF